MAPSELTGFTSPSKVESAQSRTALKGEYLQSSCGMAMASTCVLPDSRSTNPNILTLYQLDSRAMIYNLIAIKAPVQIQLVLHNPTPIV